MKYIFIILLFLLVFHTNLKSSNKFRAQGARSFGLANSSSTLIDVWAAANNQAALGFINKYQIGASTSYPINTPEIALHGLVLIIPTTYFNFGVNYYKYGFDLYNENKISLSVAKAFSDVFSLSIQTNYYITQFNAEHKSENNFTFEYGLMAKPIKDLTFAFHCHNPFYYNKIGNQKISSSSFRFGISKKYSNNLLIISELEKDFEHSAIFKVGIEYLLIKHLKIRGGINTNVVKYSFGIGYKYNKINTDIAYSYNKNIGNFINFSISYEF